MRVMEELEFIYVSFSHFLPPYYEKVARNYLNCLDSSIFVIIPCFWKDKCVK